MFYGLRFGQQALSHSKEGGAGSDFGLRGAGLLAFRGGFVFGENGPRVMAAAAVAAGLEERNQCCGGGGGGKS